MIKTKTGEKRDFHLSDKAFRMYYGGCRSAEKNRFDEKKRRGKIIQKPFLKATGFQK